MVLIVDDHYPPAKWPLGRVIQIHLGRDGLIRVVTVKTQLSEYKRPITKLCPYRSIRTQLIRSLIMLIN